MHSIKRTERGQVLILMVFGLVGLLAITALAIDGGMTYADRRVAQNVADSAAFAGALKISQGHENQAKREAEDQVRDLAEEKGLEIEAEFVDVYPYTDFSGSYKMVKVQFDAKTRTSLAHIVNRNEIVNRVVAIVRVRAESPALPGMGIIAMDNCVSDGGYLLDVRGGGNSGGVISNNGGIFLNSPENIDGVRCAINPPSSNDPWGIRADTAIISVGYHDYDGIQNISPTPIELGINYGNPIDDPLAFLEEPSCSAPGSVSGDVYQPGSYSSIIINNTDVTFEPGIYCLSGNLETRGQSSIHAEDGVLLYFKKTNSGDNSGILLSGQSYMILDAPNEHTCLGPEGPSTSSCTYKGIAIFMARDNMGTLDIRGNGETKITGLVYALNGTLIGKGGGVDPDEWVVNGQVIAARVLGDGGGSFVVTYNPDQTYIVPQLMSLER